MPTSKDMLLKRLAADKVAKAFAAGFAQAYFAQAFGSLPKSELDLLVFRLLMETGVLTPETPVYEIARALNVTPAKARNLLFQYQLRALDDDALDNTIAIQIATARFGVEGKKLTFGIESPLVRAAIQAKAKQRGVYLDISLSGEILSVQLGQLSTFLKTVLTETQQKNLLAHLQKSGLVDKVDLHKPLEAWGEKMLVEAAKEGGKHVAEKLAEQGFTYVGAALGFGGADVDFPIDLKDIA